MIDTFTTANVHAQLSHGVWYAQLPTTAQQVLLAHGQAVPMQSGQTLFWQGDACNGLYAVLSGALIIRRHSEGGRESALAVLEAPHWFGEISVIDDGPRSHVAHARDDTWLWWVPRGVMQDWLEQDPQAWGHLARLLAHKVRLLFQKIDHLAQLPAPQRLVCELLAVAQCYGQLRTDTAAPTDLATRVLPLNQEQLATLLGLSRQTVNQIVSQLQRDGLVRRHTAGMKLLDLHRLQRLATGDT